ncbi:MULTISPECIES: molybdenum cofactor biosynthesis protein MoaE [Aneurinibacillus]|uniref:Molybdopterin synthase catalytic subunit n=2 Tax=Aneurinibacillus thermoaerophilus TaxID=143495 RepID=A0A1G7ZDI8_ANETH|nr:MULTISPECIES: molybdenum cofactor biosynthesis protein MoaE [Aneurinibacillus]MED0676579.1 molybdenum cofactor biosynthesis protein MoaE [Aneurinibacillus thermoaerophilus]MED0678557.1 molybdenum cofactor biosynthesis protein MoaE [Aneurinibacillus thermoaerophilus]MED0735922.1 molybdenum cofactor biosynthesis protein MoaE [Aneurinibacillus thermoaerophilus]MED0757122.1 molybdenum cofactor biosynthesis protein MoaE [Aneurinibacillus thermoaerophilus]MED0759357.1 molybdenum cofactor biosynth
MKLFEIVEDTISVEQVMRKVIHPNCGAVNLFVGTVRELTKGKKTLYLEYAAYKEMAEKQLERIGREIQEKCPEARVAITHRIGRLDISDIAVTIAVATPHRADSYEYSRYAIERMKEIVPIWKKEHWEDGEEWIGDQKEITPYPTGKPEIGGKDA